MATITAVTDGLAAQLTNTLGLRVDTFVPDQIEAPAAFLYLTEITEQSFGYGTMDFQIDLYLLVARTSPRIGTGTLNEFASPSGKKSVWDAIGDNDTLGLGDGTHTRIVRYRGLGAEEVGLYQYFGGVFEIMVTTPG